VRWTTLVAAVLAGAASLTSAQVFEVVPDTSTVDLDSSDGTVLVSVYLDREGVTDAPWDQFNGWSSFTGFLAATGGEFGVPVENSNDVVNQKWRGRRPPSKGGVPGGTNGGFRFSAQDYGVSSGSSTGLPELDAFDTVLHGSDPALPVEGLQASDPLGGFAQDSSDRIEVLRAELVLDRPGIQRVGFRSVDAAFFLLPGFTTTYLGAQSLMSEQDAFVTATSVRPYIDGLSAGRDPVIHGQNLPLSVDQVLDVQGDVLKVRFVRDADGNGLLSPGDEFLGKDRNGADGWALSVQSDASWGTARTAFFAEAVDMNGNRSDSIRVSTDVIAVGVPYITDLTVEPALGGPGTVLAFRARGVVDTDGSILKVRLFRDADGNGRFSAGDVLLDVQSTPGAYGFGYPLVATWDAAWGSGAQTFFVQAVDDAFNRSLLKEIVVQPSSLLRQRACPGDLNGDGWVGVTDLAMFLNAYAEKEPSADVDGLPGVDQHDLIAYVTLWDRGCD